MKIRNKKMWKERDVVREQKKLIWGSYYLEIWILIKFWWKCKNKNLRTYLTIFENWFKICHLHFIIKTRIPLFRFQDLFIIYNSFSLVTGMVLSHSWGVAFGCTHFWKIGGLDLVHSIKMDERECNVELGEFIYTVWIKKWVKISIWSIDKCV